MRFPNSKKKVVEPSIAQQPNQNDISDIACDSNTNIIKPINIEEQGKSKRMQ